MELEENKHKFQKLKTKNKIIIKGVLRLLCYIINYHTITTKIQRNKHVNQEEKNHHKESM